jgi:2-polyprenyl-3-methyl-5-hydroxy-6-metoxy-1,4-benzoquinol methylase
MMFESFAQRSAEPEIMDGVEFSGDELRGCLSELRRVNRFLGGRRALSQHLYPMIEALRAEGGARIRLLDVGTGSADLPVTIVEWARSRGIALDVTVIDLNDHAAREAHMRTRTYPEITVLEADALNLPFSDRSFDFVLASMFLHHFETKGAARILSSFARVARVAFLINDLRRHPLAFYGIKMLTRVISRNRLFRYDAALSVLRGFTERDVSEIAAAAGLPLRVNRSFPFRVILTCKVYDLESRPGFASL